MIVLTPFQFFGALSFAFLLGVCGTVWILAQEARREDDDDDRRAA